MKRSFCYLLQSNSPLLAVDIHFTNIATVGTIDPSSAIVNLHQRCESAPPDILDDPIEIQYDKTRSMRPEMFYSKCVLKNFAKFLGKHLC